MKQVDTTIENYFCSTWNKNNWRGFGLFSVYLMAEPVLGFLAGVVDDALAVGDRGRLA